MLHNHCEWLPMRMTRRASLQAKGFGELVIIERPIIAEMVTIPRSVLVDMSWVSTRLDFVLGRGRPPRTTAFLCVDP